jgi:glycosyltransferase involved in cell wall biosynthesis
MFSPIREGFGMSVLEAMSSSVPVVSTKVGGIPEIVKDGRTGYMVRLGDTEKMADRSIDILTDTKKADRMGKYARRKVLREFTAQKIIPQYENFYRKILLS